MKLFSYHLNTQSPITDWQTLITCVQTLTLTACVLFTGCASLSTPQQNTPVLSDMSKNGSLNQWQLQGKIGIRQDKQAHSAYLNWQQCGDQFDIRLSGPMGQGAAHLYGNQYRVTMDRGKQGTLTARTADELLTRELGWSIPVAQLLFWIRGIPSPHQPFQPINQPALKTAQDSTGFTQSGWLLSYPSLQQIEQHSLPAKIIAKHDALRVTLLLKTWQLQSGCDVTQ